MTVAVLNATGAQARTIADRLALGQNVRRLSRNAGDGLFAVDTESVDDLARAFDGTDAVVLTSPLDYRPGVREAYAERVTRAAEQAGIGRLILNTAAAVPDDNLRPVAEDMRRIRAIVRSGSVPSTVVQPTVYLDNLLAPWALPGIVNDGVYGSPAPTTAVISYISHVSLGDFIAAAIGSPVAAGQIYDIGGPDALTATELLSIVGQAAGRNIQYIEVPFDAFAAGINAGFGSPTGDDVADSYRHLADHPSALKRDGSPWQALNVVPESAAQWAARQRWTV